ncbi:molybdopterin cofactor-binding domain-containing protein [Pollutimonas bauzanensis]|uniref:CO or xanthine dehydrogenase, Mo-binding subunit n=1 Tax=Pollutimonas bauzanensis TaxID=658167 RepID=A0A1M5QIA4_9BURK|nr:CO or xanthine dehydrogenase, Mo-binding subunit [Pollutimonas bauzanensis]
MKKRGVGMAVMWYPVGPGGDNPSTARVQMDGSARMTIYVSSPDVGQGSSTALAQIAADTVGIPLEWIDVVAGDSDYAPEMDFGSVGSRVTYVQGNAVRLAAVELQKVLVAAARKLMGIAEDRIEIELGVAWDRKGQAGPVDLSVVAEHAMGGKGPLRAEGTFQPVGMKDNRRDGQGIVYPTFVYATQMVEVEVDTETGEVTLERMVAAHDSGKIINPMLVEGQIAGGIAQGIGMALSEEVLLRDGKTLNPSLSDYFLPTSMDVPDIQFVHVEAEEETGPYGAKCVGEPALVPTAPAILNAIYDAVGVRITSLPATPEKVLEAIHEKYGGGGAIPWGRGPERAAMLPNGGSPPKSETRHFPERVMHGYSTESELLQRLEAWRAEGRGVALATVVKTWGSSPRPEGSHLAVEEGGAFVGSVSGGCVEGAVISEALDAIADGKPRLLEFGVSDEQAWEVGLACGGRVQVFVERVE